MHFSSEEEKEQFLTEVGRKEGSVLSWFCSQLKLDLKFWLKERNLHETDPESYRSIYISEMRKFFRTSGAIQHNLLNNFVGSIRLEFSVSSLNRFKKAVYSLRLAIQGDLIDPIWQDIATYVDTMGLSELDPGNYGPLERKKGH